MSRKIKYLILILAEILSVVWGICNLFGKNAVYEFGLEDMSVHIGEYTADAGGVRADSAAGITGNMVDFEHISLPKGHYIVSLKYETDVDYSNMCTVTADGAGFKGCFTNGSSLHAALQETDFDMWLLRDTDNIMVHAGYAEGTLLVRGLTITETNALYRIGLFVLLCGLMLLNGILVFRKADRQGKITKEKKKILFCMALIVIFSSVPVFTDYVFNGGDIVYHLMRIEGLKDGMLSGQFPVRIAPKWLEDNGYASAIFYPEIMLLPAALLRMIGFPITTSYQLYIILVNFLTAVSAYYSFEKIFRKAYAGLVCSMLYTLSIYRIFNLYGKGALGEALAMIFLPLVVYGLFRVFTEDCKAKKYKWCFVPLTIGFCGLIQTHLLTCELVGGFTILLCIVLWKKVFRKETFWALAETVICSALISAWFLVPFLDYMITGNFVIQNVSARTIQERGLYIANLLTAIPFYGSNTQFVNAGMTNTAAVGVGFTLIAVLLGWGYLRFVENRDGLRNGGLTEEEIGFAKIASVFSVIAMIMSLYLFPWNWIQSKHAILATLVSSLQFPTRLLTIASILLVALAGVLCRYVLASGREWWKLAFFGGICGLTVITSLLTMSDQLYKGASLKIYNTAGMGYGYISGAEYLPYGTDQAKLKFRNPQGSTNVVLENYEKGALQTEVSCHNDSEDDGLLILPLLYYKGYQAYDMDTGDKMEVLDEENHSVCVRVPAGYSGTIRAYFASPWYWHLAEGITVLSTAGLIILYRKNNRKEVLE